MSYRYTLLPDTAGNTGVTHGSAADVAYLNLSIVAYQRSIVPLRRILRCSNRMP